MKLSTHPRRLHLLFTPTIAPFFMALFVMALFVFATAQAAAPMVKTQAPGYYRMMLGDFEVTALNDSVASWPDVDVFSNLDPLERDVLLKRTRLTFPYDFSTNAYLINTGEKLVLIDAGLGSPNRPDGQGSHLLENLRLSGYQPEQVDEVYLTHMHPDHVGGLMVDQALAFPNAIVRADRRELAQWRASAAAGDARVRDRQVAKIESYIKAGRFAAFDGDTTLVAGIRAVAAHGHTAGHTFYAVESHGEKLMIWGDFLMIAKLHLEKPTLSMLGETDIAAGIALHQRLFAEAADEGYLIAAAHVSFPGIGRLRAVDDRYEWQAVDYRR